MKTIALLTLLLFATGCLTPDESKAFKPDFKAARPSQPADLPEERPGASELIPDAGGTLTISEEQAVVLALERSRDLDVERLGPPIAGTFQAIERGVFDPEIFGGVVGFREGAEETSRSTGESFSVRGEELDVEAGVRQDLPSGTSVEARVEQRYTNSNRAPEQQKARVGLTVTQSLLRGAGSTVNLVNVRQAQLQAQASEFELRRFAEVLLAETKVAYWQFVLARQEIEIFSRSLQFARKQLAEIEERIRVGFLPETEAAAARAEVALREQALINATSNVEAREIRLLRIIGGDRQGKLDIAITPTSKPEVTAEPVTDLDDRLELAVTQRADLCEARLRLEQDRLETIVTKNGVLPRLEVFMTLGPTGFGQTFVDSFREMNGDTLDFTVGVTFSQLLGNRTAKAENRAAWLEKLKAARSIDNLEQVIRMEVRLAAVEVERTRQQIGASRTTRELQEKTVAAERERFQVGTSTTLLVAQAERDLLVTQIAEVQAVVAFRIARVALHLAEGTLLERHGVTLGE